VVQLAKIKGITTINIIEKSTDEEEMVTLLQNIGGDIVVPAYYALTWKFKALIADLPKPALAIRYAGKFDDQALLSKLQSAIGIRSKLRSFVESSSRADLDKLKLASVLRFEKCPCVSHGPSAAALPGAFNLDEWFKGGDVAETIKAVSDQIKLGDLNLWVESFPPEDLDYASRKALEPFPGYRSMILKF
jgi:hypothetical protein